MSKIVPIEVKRISNNGCGIGLSIKWSNGEIRELPTKLLREKCPCATCQELSGTSNHSKPLSTKSSLLRVVKSTIEENADKGISTLVQLPLVGTLSV